MSDYLVNDPALELRRTGWVIAASYFTLGLIDPNLGLWQLPLQWFLKVRLHLGAEPIAYFFATALIPWYFKPLIGLISDALPLFGSRRRSFLLIGAGGAILTSLSLAFVPSELRWLLAGALGLHTFLMLVSTATGGLLVEEGQKRHATGRLTSWRSGAESVAAFCAGPLGGWLAEKSFGIAAGLSTGLAITLLVFYVLLLREPPAPHLQRGSLGKALLHPVLALLRVRNVWIATFAFCCYHIAPGFQTPLFFRQTNVLHLGAPFIGSLTLIGSAGGLVGAGAYGWSCRRLPFRWLMPIAIAAGILVTLSYVWYNSVRSAIIIEASNGVIGTFAFIGLLDFIARSLSPGQEALGYAFVFSAGNIASSASDIIGSRWSDAGVSFASLVWINAGATALILLAIPFFPKRLLREADAIT